MAFYCSPHQKTCGQKQSNQWGREHGWIWAESHKRYSERARVHLTSSVKSAISWGGSTWVQIVGVKHQEFICMSVLSPFGGLAFALTGTMMYEPFSKPLFNGWLMATTLSFKSYSPARTHAIMHARTQRRHRQTDRTANKQNNWKMKERRGLKKENILKH